MNDIVSNPRKYIIWLVGCGLLSFAVLFYGGINIKDRSLLNGVSIFGTVFSLIGFLYAYLQLANIRQVSYVLKSAIEKNISAFNDIVILSSISTALSKTASIQESINADMGVSLYKMKELKLLFLEIKNNENIVVYKEEFQTLFENFCVDIKNLNDHLINHTDITPGKISSNLEEIITILKQAEIHLKENIQKTL